MGAVIVAPRYVPRADDPPVWGSKSNTVAPVLLLALAVSIPFKSYFWPANYFDAPVWSGHATSALTTLNSLKTSLIVAPRYVPRADDPGVWGSRSSGTSPILLQALVPVNVLLSNGTPWRNDYDSVPFWTGGPTPAGQVLLASLAANLPFRPSFWPENYFDAPVWTGSPTAFPRGVATAPKTGVVASPRYVPRPPDVTYWGATSEGVPLLLLQTQQAVLPFRQGVWNFHYDVDGDPKWVGDPSNTGFLLLNTTLQLYAPAAPRMFIGADTAAEVWQPKSRAVPLTLQNVIFTQSLFASSLIATKVAVAFNGFTRLAGATSIAAVATDAFSPQALLGAKATAKTDGRASIALAAALSAMARTAVRSTGGTFAGKTALAAATKIAAFGRAISPSFVALFASAMIKTAALAAGTSSGILLFARTLAKSSAGATSGGKTILSAAAKATSSANSASTVKTSLAAAVRVASFARAVQPLLFVAMFGRAVSNASARSSMAAKAVLSAVTQTVTSVRAGAAFNTKLAAATRATATARAGISALTPLAALAGATLIRLAARAAFALSKPRTSQLYPRIISIYRSTTVAGSTDHLGLVGYSGMATNPNPSDSQGETLLFTNIMASIQATQQGRKKDSSLPSDAVWAPTWKIYVPRSVLAKGSIRDRDVIVDDEGYRYQVGQAYWNILGYGMTCIRLEA